jgi:hypothetical protein
MSNSGKLAAGLALLGACAAGIVACESVPLTAAPGTSMTLIANPPFVIANGGVSVVTAILVEPAGTFVPDGTEVFFFTNLGRVDSPGKTVNGVARVNFVSDARSGKATVTGISGGPAPAPTASTAATRSGVTASAVGDTAAAAALGASAAAGENSATVDISIGSALPERVLVGADPQRITGSRRSTITATVFDEFGNPVQNVPVVFSLSGTLIEESLASGGGQQFTDSSGQVRDTLSTKALVGGLQKTITVTATTANGVDGTVSVFVN